MVGQNGCNQTTSAECPRADDILANMKRKLASYGMEAPQLGQVSITKDGGKNFTVVIPLSMTVGLPSIPLDFLGNMVQIPGIQLETDGNMNSSLVIRGSFKLEGGCGNCSASKRLYLSTLPLVHTGRTDVNGNTQLLFTTVPFEGELLIEAKDIDTSATVCRASKSVTSVDLRGGSDTAPLLRLFGSSSIHVINAGRHPIDASGQRDLQHHFIVLVHAILAAQ
jgi:hypothetical protein